jgi:hypothetical protein
MIALWNEDITLTRIGGRSGTDVPGGRRFRYTLSRNAATAWAPNVPGALSGRCWLTVQRIDEVASAARIEGRLTVSGSERAGDFDADREANERAKLGAGATLRDALFDVVFDEEIYLTRNASTESTIRVEIEASRPVELWMKPLFRFRATGFRLVSANPAIRAGTARLDLRLDGFVIDALKVSLAL